MMHTILVVVGGLVLGVVFGLFGYLWGDTLPAVVAALRIFVPVWLIVSGINLWVGVSRAGYPLKAELPIALLVFAVPAIAAIASSLALAHRSSL